MAIDTRPSEQSVESVPLAARLARHTSGLQLSSLPSEVVEKVKMCFFDAFTCAFAGYDLDWCRAATGAAQDLGGRPEATIWTNGARVGASEAAFANAVHSHSIIQEDMHNESQSHPGTMVFPVVLALAERDGAAGRDLIPAIVAGYELIGRVGRATVGPEFRQRGFRPSGSFGALGAAAAASRLMGFDAERTLNAIGIAGNFAGGLNEWGNAGSTDIYMHNGQAARSGLLAALLARHGANGPRSLLEGKEGFLNAYGGASALERVGMVTEGLGERFEIMKVWHKPAPACAFTQTTAQVAVRLARREPIDPDQVRSGVIRTHRMGKHYTGLDNGGPFDSILAAKLSNQFAVAAALVHRTVVHDNYRNYDDPRVAALAERLTVEIDPNADAVFPTQQMLSLELQMADGRTLRAGQPDIDQPTRPELVERLRVYLEPVVGAVEATRLVDLIDHLESVADVRDLIPRHPGKG
jgi:2-methylcitrate dehydratase PrpD